MKVYFRGSRSEARQVARALAEALARGGDPNLARSVFTVLGLAALSDIKADFIRKARGEVGEDGVKWAPLAESTLKRRRGGGAGGVEILRDTSVLLNSISPGQISGGANNLSYSKPNGDGGAEQVFHHLENGVVVGTNVTYGVYHQNGTKHMPARPFLPDGQKIPREWKQRWLKAAMQAVRIAARTAFERRQV